MHAHTRRNMCECTHTYGHTCTCKPCTHMCRHMHTPMFTNVCACVHIYVHTMSLCTHTHKPSRQRTNTLLGGWAVLLTQVGSHWNQGTSVLVRPDSLFLSHSLWDKGTTCAGDVHRGWMETVPESPSQHILPQQFINNRVEVEDMADTKGHTCVTASPMEPFAATSKQ